jgi:hypothetical protein
MPEKQVIHFIKSEDDPDFLYLMAVTCLEKLTKLEKANTIKAVIDAGTTSLMKLVKK